MNIDRQIPLTCPNIEAAQKFLKEIEMYLNPEETSPRIFRALENIDKIFEELREVNGQLRYWAEENERRRVELEEKVEELEEDIFELQKS